MPIQRAKPLQDLYEEVADYDLVIAPDLPLASALDRRLEEPHFGPFATTPRRRAGTPGTRDENRQAFLEVVETTDHPWRDVAYAVGNALLAWEHEGSVDAVLAYDAYADEATRAVVDTLSDLETTSRLLDEFEIPADESVAVVGYDQLTPLERSVLPAEFDRVELFTDEPFDRPDFHVFDSPTDIVEALLDTITAENAGDVAVVLTSGGQYSPLVESALEAADIPFYGGPGFMDDPDHRAFVQLLRTAFRGPGTTVGDVRPVLTRLGGDVPLEHDDKRVETVDDPALTWLKAFGEAVESRTFGEALTAYGDRIGADLDTFTKELRSLGIADEPVTAGRVDDLAYYLQTFDVPVDRENEGVLLADATSSGYVDRPTVFYLGLDRNWTHSTPQRPWVDTGDQFDRHLAQFQLLLQGGSDQYYLVQDAAGGQPVTPCLYFEELLDADYERFGDLATVEHTRMPRATPGGFDPPAVDAEPEMLETISQSSLNTYVNSPRDYLFSQLLDQPDRDYFVRGTLFHDFAECYVEYPELVTDDEIDALVDLMDAEIGPFVSAVDEPLQRREFHVGLETIMGYLDEHPPEPAAFLTSTSGWGTNVFAEHFDVSLDSPVTERWFENDELGIKGKIDLVAGPTELLDYKSSGKNSATEVVQSGAVDPPDDTPNFQAVLYLSHFRTLQPGEELTFTFFHVLETMDDVVAGDADLDDALTHVTYQPRTFDEFVGSRAAYEALLGGYYDCQETFEDLGYEAYAAIMDDLAFPATDDLADLRASSFAAAFTAAVDARTGDDVDAEKGCDQAIRELDDVRGRTLFSDDLDAFEAFVQERLEDLNRCLAGEERFPVDGVAGEPNYRRVDNRDLLLSGERRE